MPTVFVSLKEGLTRNKKRDLIEKVTEAISDSTGYPKETVAIIIDEKSSDNFGNGGIQLTDKIEAREKANENK
ncbi:MAG: 2-hydroxymuconate tautomerase [Lachnospirales bacterium]